VSSVSSSTRFSYPVGGSGRYDGQFSISSVVDPVNARFTMDSPVIEFYEILYPRGGTGPGVGQAPLIAVHPMIPHQLVGDCRYGPVAGAWLRRRGDVAMVLRWCTHCVRGMEGLIRDT